MQKHDIGHYEQCVNIRIMINKALDDVLTSY